MKPIADGYGLIEGPVWHPTLGLLFSDVINGGVFHLDPTDRAHVVFPYRRGIGGMVLHEQNGLVVSGRNIAYKEFGQESSAVILDSNPDHDNVGYNDITTDSQGRIYAGSLGSSPVFDDGREPTAGNLHLIDVDGTSRTVAEDILLTNGLRFSPDGTTLYHSDSRRGHILKYATKPNGELEPMELFAQFSKGAPDGLAVAQDGSVWVALAGGGGVCILSSAGEQIGFIPIPLPMCTSVCFGGDDMKTLYIVTGSDGIDGNDRGAIFRHTVSVPGLAVPAARIDIQRT